MNLTSFAPALIGGIAIGSAAAMLLYFNGRIAGISGIAAKLFFVSKGDWLWRGLFLIGLVGGARLAYMYFGHVPIARGHFPAWLLAVAGLVIPETASPSPNTRPDTMLTRKPTIDLFITSPQKHGARQSP